MTMNNRLNLSGSLLWVEKAFLLRKNYLLLIFLVFDVLYL